MSVDGVEGGQPVITEAQRSLHSFWPSVTDDIRHLTQQDLRTQELPLARIKRIMKLDDDVKMISAEAPVLFSKAAEIFVRELTLRAWSHTEDNKRRTLQRNDIAMAITKYDQFDFLIDIVPRDELKPSKTRDDANRTGLPTDQHYFQIAQHYQAVLQQSAAAAAAAANNSTSNSQTTVQQQQQTATTTVQPQTIQIVQGNTVQSAGSATTTGQGQQQQAPQIIQLQPQQQPTAAAAAQQQQQTTTAATTNSTGGIQIIQQIIGPDGQVQQIPVQLTAQQLQMIKLQMSGATQQPIIIQTAPIQVQLTAQQLQMIKLQMSGATQQPIIIQTAPIQAVTQQQQQQQQQQQAVVTTQPQIIQLQQSGGQPVYITQSQTQQ